MTALPYRKSWDELSEREKIETLRSDIKTISDELHKMALAHQNLMSAHARTAETVQEAMTKAEEALTLAALGGRRT